MGPWWAPGAIVVAAGLVLTGLGALGTFDQQELVTAGLVTISGGTGFLIGKQSPTP